MKLQFRGLRALALGASALTSLAAGQAFAQEGTSQASDGVAIEEIVVTALKRSTTIQTTPISISAVTEKSLQALGASGIQDYFRTVPNLQVEGNSPTSRRLTLRGVRSAGEATVGLYYDETPLTGPAGTTADASSTSADVNLFDAERIEVLRGPQGTLYGSGSMGGTLRVILNKPNASQYAGAVEVGGTAQKDGGQGYSVKGMVNVPLIEDKLAARLVLYKAEQGGYIDDVLLKKKDINDQHSSGGRLMLGFTPTENLTITASGLFQKTTLDGQNSWYPALGKKDYSTNARVIAPTEDNLRLYNVTAKWDLNFATVTATSSYYKWTLLRNSDYSPTLSANRANATSCRNYIAGGPAPTGATNPACTTAQMAQYTAYADSRIPGALYQPMGLTSWNHELRMNGSLFEDKVDWTAGVYLEDRDDYIESQVAKGDAATGVINPNDLTAWRHVGTDTKQTAFFGEVAYKPIDKLTLTAGVRRFKYDKTVSGQVLISNFITQSYKGDPASVDASADGWVSKVNVSYQVTSDIMVYGLAAKGFRPGGANNVPGLASALLAYAPDSLWNYETGIKSQWFDRRLTLNAAAYQIDWSNMQISATSANGAFSYLTNAGKAKIKGFEVEAVARPMRGLTLQATAAWVDAKLTEDQANSTILITGSTGLRGDEFPNVADFSGSASAEYSWPLNGDLNGLVRADYAYVGESASQFRPTYVYYEKQGDYGYANLRAGVEGADWGAYLFVNNVTDEVGLMSVSSALNNKQQVVSINPRTAGFSVRKRF
ncbi:TonB-dependent receptor [Caulobacter segnis]|uniref:TonB-dependent receptor plug n=2 Tax=Caulobacter segnis TaxID=88688 RepID=D5VHL5_CAUST|nr:TonB-dependent receptor [Caulobacter segnis]ADG08996.1 TonB-dependent receptor plug [Caulobacter segnis ATCC 21756]AVQ00827.1 TonB-dependent receptor [Caulobacter segnis]